MGEVIAELRDEACTQWSSGWLAFHRRVSRAFPGLDFNIQLSDEEVEESASKAKTVAGAEVPYGAPDRAPLPDDLRGPPEASSPTLPAGLCPLTPLLLWIGASPQAPRLFILASLFPGAELGILYCF